MDRRGFFGALALTAIPVVLGAIQQRPGDSTHTALSAGDAGFLPNPALAGVSRPAVTKLDNDPLVIGIEHRVRCPCPCGLDVYTCRTTDFTCSYSPERHQEIMALVTQGMTPDEVVGALVAKYGESTLMAPKPRGFNLVGYLLPGSLVLLLGAALTSVILSRRRGAGRGAAPVPALAGGRAAAGASPDELAKLAQAMRELDP
ncbi:MAG TPA: cytochrome c-type biogenesis protein CcmH [Gemmatimonadales bacterium]|nr:cytochrome c-type biogenesis protein CcmH [Gemmatimonadales bacterium]